MPIIRYTKSRQEQVPPAGVIDDFATLGERKLTVKNVAAERAGAAMSEPIPAIVITDIKVTGHTEDDA